MSVLVLPWLYSGLQTPTPPSVVVDDSQDGAYMSPGTQMATARALSFLAPMLLGALAWEIIVTDVATCLAALARKWKQRPRQRSRQRNATALSASSSLSSKTDSSTPPAKLVASSGLLDARWHTRLVRTVVHSTSFSARAAAVCMLGVALFYMHDGDSATSGTCKSAAWPRAIVGMGATGTSLMVFSIICNALLVVCDGGPRNMYLFAIVAAAWILHVGLAYSSLAFVSNQVSFDDDTMTCASLRIQRGFGVFYLGCTLNVVLLPILLFTRQNKRITPSTPPNEKIDNPLSLRGATGAWHRRGNSTVTYDSAYSARNAGNEASVTASRPPFQRRFPLVISSIGSNAINPLQTLRAGNSNQEEGAQRQYREFDDDLRHYERNTLVLNDEDVFQAVRRAHFEDSRTSTAPQGRLDAHNKGFRIEALAAVCISMNSSRNSRDSVNDNPGQPSCALRYETIISPFASWWLAAVATMFVGLLVSFINWSAVLTFTYFLVSTVFFVLFCQRLTTAARRRLVLDVIDDHRGTAPLPLTSPEILAFGGDRELRATDDATLQGKSTNTQRASFLAERRRLSLKAMPSGDLSTLSQQASFLPSNMISFRSVGRSSSNSKALLTPLQHEVLEASGPSSSGRPAGSPPAVGIRQKSENSIRAKILSLVRDSDGGGGGGDGSRKDSASSSNGKNVHNSGSSRSQSARISPSVKHSSASGTSARHNSVNAREESSIELDRAVASIHELPTMLSGEPASGRAADKEKATKWNRASTTTTKVEETMDTQPVSPALDLSVGNDSAADAQFGTERGSIKISRRGSSLHRSADRIDDEVDIVTPKAFDIYQTNQTMDYFTPLKPQPRRKRSNTRHSLRETHNSARESGGESKAKLSIISDRVLGVRAPLRRLSSHGSLEHSEKASNPSRSNSRQAWQVPREGAQHKSQHKSHSSCGESESATGVTGAFVDYYNNRQSGETNSTTASGLRPTKHKVQEDDIPPLPATEPSPDSITSLSPARPLSRGHLLTTTVDSFGVANSAARFGASRKVGESGSDRAMSVSVSSTPPAKTAPPSSKSDSPGPSHHTPGDNMRLLPTSLAVASTPSSSSYDLLSTGSRAAGSSSVLSFQSAVEVLPVQHNNDPDENVLADAVLETMLSYDAAYVQQPKGQSLSVVRGAKHDDEVDDIVDAPNQADDYFTSVILGGFPVRSTRTSSSDNVAKVLAADRPSSAQNDFKQDDDVGSVDSEVERKHEEVLRAGIEEADEDLLFQFIDPLGFPKEDGRSASRSSSNAGRAVKLKKSSSNEQTSSGSRGATDGADHATVSSFGLGDISGNPRLRGRPGSSSRSKASKSSNSRNSIAVQAASARDSIAVQAANAVVLAAPHRRQSTTEAKTAVASSPVSTSGGDSYFDTPMLRKTSHPVLRPKLSLGHLTAGSVDTGRSYSDPKSNFDIDSAQRSPAGYGERGGIEVPLVRSSSSGVLVSGHDDDAFRPISHHATSSLPALRHSTRAGPSSRQLSRFPSYESSLLREPFATVHEHEDDPKGKGRALDSDDKATQQQWRGSVARESALLEAVESSGSSLHSNKSNQKQTGTSSSALPLPQRDDTHNIPETTK